MNPRRLTTFSSAFVFTFLLTAVHHSDCLQNHHHCDFEKEGYLCDGWREEHPVNTIWTIADNSVIQPNPTPMNQNGSKFLYITAASQSEAGFYCLRSRSFVLNATHVLEFDYLLRATGNTNVKVFADINTIPGNFLSFYEFDTNNEWVKGEAIIEVSHPQTRVEIEIRGDIENSEDFVAIDNLRITARSLDDLRRLIEPTTVATTFPLPDLTNSSPTDWEYDIDDVVLPESVSSQIKHSYSTLLIVICICLSILGSTLGMTLLLKRCYVHKEEFMTRSESSYST